MASVIGAFFRRPAVVDVGTGLVVDGDLAGDVVDEDADLVWLDPPHAQGHRRHDDEQTDGDEVNERTGGSRFYNT